VTNNNQKIFKTLSTYFSLPSFYAQIKAVSTTHI